MNNRSKLHREHTYSKLLDMKYHVSVLDNLSKALSENLPKSDKLMLMKGDNRDFGLQELRVGKTKQTLLIITEHPPKSHSPSGERILHAALAGSSVFKSVIVLSLWGGRKRHWQGQTKQHETRVSLKAVNFVRGMLYPLRDILDPIKFLVFFVHALTLSKRYKPLCILASMPPFETGICAWLLSKCGSSELAVDLRDDWESAVATQLKRYFPAAVFHILSLITNKVYQSAFVIFAATQTIGDTVRKRGVTTPIILVPNGADTSVFLPKNEGLRRNIRMKYNLPQDKIVAVYCGSGTILYYRLDVVLSCLNFLPPEVKDKIYVVFYVYDGTEKLEQEQKELGIAGSILEIRGPLPRESLAEVLAACDIGLLPFDDKAYLLCARSTKLYEYLSSGLYVICSGPEGGELDAFFSANPALGLFIRPNAKDFALSVGNILKVRGDLLGDDLRESRHSFIEKNYDRRAVMKVAMKDLLERVQSSVNAKCFQNRNKR